ncbi:NB-ARC domain-containing protein [Actinoplanes nipponensis]|uniref:NB-ARC domain-containing protein n=1 Tax=Actinoplanes nipponensis TaxID=135950 RepID=UPI0035E4EADF
MPRPAQLPAAAVRLAGRADECARITALSDRGRPPVLLSGPIGAGKSATAMHWCHRNAARFPDGVLYADLADPGTGPHEALTGFLLALGIAPDRVPAHPAHCAALYRSLIAGRRMLVLLDNAADETQLGLLLAAAPGSQVLITSRSRLAGLDGLARLTLEPLPPEQAVALLGTITGHDQVAEHLEHAVEVAALCDHLPVVLRTIGTRIALHRGWTLPRAAAHLRDERGRIDSLAPGLRDSFRAAHRALDPDSRRMLMRVARLPQAEFDAGGPARAGQMALEQAEESLEALVDAGLLQAAPARGRYRLPVLFRLLALEVLRSATPVAAVQAAG